MDVERRNQAIHLHNEAIQAAATDKQLAYRLFGSAVDAAAQNIIAGTITVKNAL